MNVRFDLFGARTDNLLELLSHTIIGVINSKKHACKEKTAIVNTWNSRKNLSLPFLYLIHQTCQLSTPAESKEIFLHHYAAKNIFIYIFRSFSKNEFSLAELQLEYIRQNGLG